MNLNHFIHQNQILDGLGTPSETIQNLILMHKLIRIQGVSESTAGAGDTQYVANISEKTKSMKN